MKSVQAGEAANRQRNATPSLRGGNGGHKFVYETNNINFDPLVLCLTSSIDQGYEVELDKWVHAEAALYILSTAILS